MRCAAAVGLALLALGGCGDDSEDASSSPSAEEQIRTIVEQRKADPPSICDHMTAELLESVGGLEDCRQLAAADDNRDANAEIERIVVDGDHATVDFTGGQEEDASVVFTRVDGEWRLDVRD